MEKILFVNACVRPESRTLILARRVLDRLQGMVEEVNLEREGIRSLHYDTLQQRDAALGAGDMEAPVLRFARQFAKADVIVMAAPYWDLSFPSMVKNYIEAVTVCGMTFYYTPEGRPAGLCRARKLIYVTTAGGPIMEPDFGYDYIRALADNFYGIPECIAFKAENLDIIGADVDSILEKVKKKIDKSEL